MKIFKKFYFWLSMVYLLVIFLNLIGVDDKNILLFFTNPFGWIAETHWFVVNFTHPSNIPLFAFYIIGLLIWFLAGLLIDKLIRKFKKKYA